MIDIDKIEAAAKPVKVWSKSCNQAWIDTSEDESAAVVGNITEEGTEYPVVIVDCDQYTNGDNSLPLAKFYATANPATVLEMVALIRAQRNVMHQALDALKNPDIVDSINRCLADDEAIKALEEALK